jgi:hypothetical protein
MENGGRYANDKEVQPNPIDNPDTGQNIQGSPLSLSRRLLSLIILNLKIGEIMLLLPVNSKD